MPLKKIRLKKRLRLVLRYAFLHFVLATLGGVILLLSMSRGINQVSALLIFSSTIAITSIFIASLDRVFFMIRIHNIPFIFLQLIRMFVITILVLIVLGVFHYFREGNFILRPQQLNVFFNFLAYSSLVSLVISIMVIVNRMLGYGVLIKYLYGWYHLPREEERIFMFLDLKSSTTIAEKLGNKRFFSLINDILFDITNIIIENEGEIYKYVGDAIIISWSIKKGIQDNNCIYVYFEIEDRLRKRAKKYMEKYGITPEMKAGVNVGHVIVGELGDFKSEIAYMGDVVNTTSRIQTECKTFNVDILFSGELNNILQKPIDLHIKKITTIQLRGKNKETELFNAVLPI